MRIFLSKMFAVGKSCIWNPMLFFDDLIRFCDRERQYLVDAFVSMNKLIVSRAAFFLV